MCASNAPCGCSSDPGGGGLMVVAAVAWWACRRVVLPALQWVGVGLFVWFSGTALWPGRRLGSQAGRKR